MLVKIGDCWVDPQEIALIRGDEPGPDYQPNAGSQMLIQLRRGAGIWITATMDEAEAALIDAGVIEEPTYDEPPELTEAELTKLSQLYDNGYKYLARDGDGKLFAYISEPNSDGVGFFPSSFTDKATQVFEAFDSLLPGEVLDISDTIEGWTL